VLGTWDHLTVSVKMVLVNGLAGMMFGGCQSLQHLIRCSMPERPLLSADVGGFFGNPEPDMLVRWYQVGAFAPFFRAHAHIDTKRREPFLLDEPYKGIVKDVLRLRYSLLPVWYTAFRAATINGVPVLRYGSPSCIESSNRRKLASRPHYVVFPHHKAGFSIDDQYFIGDSGLLVKPITEKDVTEASVYLSEDRVRSFLYGTRPCQ